MREMSKMEDSQHIENQESPKARKKSSSEPEIPSRAQRHRRWLIETHQLNKKSKTIEGKDKGDLELISFSIMGETYGVELIHLKEILKATEIIRVPRSAESLRGIINLRGSVLTVIDLKKRLGMGGDSEITRNSRVMIVRQEKRSIGLLVDRVNEIIRLEGGSVENPPAGLPEIKRKYVKGIGKVDGHVIILPNLERVCTVVS